jgi:hypothetical protein
MTDLGILSRDEQTLRPRVTASDLIAFCDSQRVTIGPPIRDDGSGWLIAFDRGSVLDSVADAFEVKAWGPTVDGQKPRLDKRCSTLTEALLAIHAYELMLPQ